MDIRIIRYPRTTVQLVSVTLQFAWELNATNMCSAFIVRHTLDKTTIYTTVTKT